MLAYLLWKVFNKFQKKSGINPGNNFYNRIIKRAFDLLAALTGLIILLPVIFIIILLLVITGHKRFFFVQKRVGLNEKLFNLIKFRSMTEARNETGNLLPDDKRLTNFGRALRITSLDELPQLVNVLKGDMSLVGPRPLLLEYLPLYSKEQKKRHKVKPGITGWAQINGRNAITWQQKFNYDCWYVENQSFKLDIKIFFLTFKRVISGTGVSKEGHVTTEAFTGNN